MFAATAKAPNFPSEIHQIHSLPRKNSPHIKSGLPAHPAMSVDQMAGAVEFGILVLGVSLLLFGGYGVPIGQWPIRGPLPR